MCNVILINQCHVVLINITSFQNIKPSETKTIFEFTCII